MTTMPDFSGFLPTILFFCTIIVAVIAGLVHEFWLMPPIARAFRKSKFTKGITALIQDLSGNVLHITSVKDLPEGVTKTKRGFFLLPMSGTPLSMIPGTKAYKPRPPGRPPKDDVENVVPPKPTGEKEMEEYAELYGKMVYVPILRGLGKQVFFGCIESPALSTIWTIAHCDLLQAKRLVPQNLTKTQLDALATGERLEGMKMASSDLVKWIFYVILAVIPIAVIGLVFWFLKA